MGAAGKEPLCEQISCADCVLRGCARFAPTTPEQRALIARLRQAQVTLPARTRIVEKGQIGDGLYTLYEGWAFSSISNRGWRQIIDFILPGDSFGFEIELFGATSQTIELITRATICVFAEGALDEMTRADPELARALAKTAAIDVRSMQQRIAALGALPAAARTASLLLTLYQRLDALGRVRGQRCALPLTQRHLAEALGLTHTHVNVVLKGLREDRILTLARNELVVHDLAKLHKSAHGGTVGLDQKMLL